MARKPRNSDPPDDFDADEATAADETDTGRPVRSEHRADMDELKALSNQIAAMPVGRRRALPLDADAQAQFDLLAAAEPKPDRRRLLMRAKLLLANVDPELLRAALAGDGPAARWESESVRWRQRLVAGDDALLQDFLQECPKGDRQALRTAAREARGTGPAATRAFARLLQLVREAGPPQLP